MIVHRDVGGEPSPLRAPGWRAEAVTARSREEALERAALVAAKAHERPEEFARLAAEYSDDLATRDRGGSLGTWSAELMPPEFLDAIATMQPGEVSRVVETPMGYHLLQLRSPPSVISVAAQEVVIAYEDTTRLHVRKGRDVRRSRSEAEAIAWSVVRKARANPSSFPDLVRELSDHEDAETGGDIGTWSTARTAMLNREIEAVAALRLGEISAPVDSADGFRVLLRVESASTKGVEAVGASGLETTGRSGAAETPIAFVLPSPRHPNLVYFVRNASSPQELSGYVRHVTENVPALLGARISAGVHERVGGILQDLARQLANEDPEQRVEAYLRAEDDLKAALGPQLHGELSGAIRDRIAQDLLTE